MKHLLLAATAIAALTLAAPSQAAISEIGGTARALNFAGGQPNEGVAPLGLLPAVLVRFGSNIFGDAGTYMAEYLGAEAGFNNEFRVGGFGSLFSGGNSNAFNFAGIGAPLYFNVAAPGLLDFAFRANGSLANAVSNLGVNPDDTTIGQNGAANPSFVSLLLPSGLYLFFDDQGGERRNGSVDDDNHDDMVIRITAIPEPASLMLLGAGLIGLGVAARRRRSQTV